MPKERITIYHPVSRRPSVVTPSAFEGVWEPLGYSTEQDLLACDADGCDFVAKTQGGLASHQRSHGTSSTDEAEQTPEPAPADADETSVSTTEEDS